MKLFKYGCVFICGMNLSVVQARSNSLDAGALQQIFSGRTVFLSTPIGALPIRYSPNGTMVATSRALAIASGVSKDTGSWWITGNRFCQRWQTWLSGKPQCFTVRREGGTLHWTSNDGMSGTAAVAR